MYIHAVDAIRRATHHETTLFFETSAEYLPPASTEPQIGGVTAEQLQRTVTCRRGDGSSAPFHYALAARFMRLRAAAELQL